VQLPTVVAREVTQAAHQIIPLLWARLVVVVVAEAEQLQQLVVLALRGVQAEMETLQTTEMEVAVELAE
jgi:hypothetical protein